MKKMEPQKIYLTDNQVSELNYIENRFTEMVAAVKYDLFTFKHRLFDSQKSNLDADSIKLNLYLKEANCRHIVSEVTDQLYISDSDISSLLDGFSYIISILRETITKSYSCILSLMGIQLFEKYSFDFRYDINLLDNCSLYYIKLSNFFAIIQNKSKSETITERSDKNAKL